MPTSLQMSMMRLVPLNFSRCGVCTMIGMLVCLARSSCLRRNSSSVGVCESRPISPIARHSGCFTHSGRIAITSLFTRGSLASFGFRPIVQKCLMP